MGTNPCSSSRLLQHFASQGCPRASLTTQDDPHAVRRLRHRAWLILGQMRPLQHAHCGAECQVQHWKEGGHDQLCKKIKRAGGANNITQMKYSDAVVVAAEACAEDTKGQTCYICTRLALEEGGPRAWVLVPRDGGFAHVSCLAEEAKILVAESRGEQFREEGVA